jgi:predicted fused transcriptional regulator/phosphomethylpyrimidine kinase
MFMVLVPQVATNFAHAIENVQAVLINEIGGVE